MPDKKVLIVDDSRTARLMIMKCLQIAADGDPDFYQASDGKEALEVLDSQPVDLILTDVIMPNMDGVELVREVRKRPAYANTPILLFSSLEKHAIPLEQSLKDTVLILQKPITPETVTFALEALLC